MNPPKMILFATSFTKFKNNFIVPIKNEKT